jgi:hypothetical protein
MGYTKWSPNYILKTAMCSICEGHDTCDRVDCWRLSTLDKMVDAVIEEDYATTDEMLNALKEKDICDFCTSQVCGVDETLKWMGIKCHMSKTLNNTCAYVRTKYPPHCLDNG